MTIRYKAYYRNADGAMAEIDVAFEPGRHGDRTETLTGRTFRTDREAMAAMAEANCAGATGC